MSSLPLARGRAGADPATQDRSAWRTFFGALAALAAALVLALYSRVAAENAQVWVAGFSALAALAVAGWVAATMVPTLVRRTPLRWFAVRIDYRLTQEGMVYLGGIFVVTLAALNTGNNLLFMILASLLAGILVSGVLSQIVLSNVELRLELPEHIFAGQPVRALAELINHKRTLPSFSLRLTSAASPSRRAGAPAERILAQPVYFPYLPPHQAMRQSIEMNFPRRGVYRQEALGLQTRFPFGFLEKTRRLESHLQAIVYPAVEPTAEFYELLPLVSGEIESAMRGRGHDLYSIRDYQTSDTARHVDWKASAKRGTLQVREFAREDERRVMLVLDPFDAPRSAAHAALDPAFERAVTLCASLAWHFYEIESVLAFRTAGFETPMAPAGEVIYDILDHLAAAAPQPAAPGRSFLGELADSPQIFKIILTRQPRGSIPTNLWGSSYILFLES
jgi:uncharacterized protein (DUF58 family)